MKRYVKTCVEVLAVNNSEATLRTDHTGSSRTAYFMLTTPRSWQQQSDGSWSTTGTCGCCQQPYRLVLPRHLYVEIKLR